MATFKNPFGERRDIPLLELHVGIDETFEVPDESAASLEAQGYLPSKTKTPDVTVDPAVAEAVTAVTADAPAAPAFPTS